MPSVSEAQHNAMEQDADVVIQLDAAQWELLRQAIDMSYDHSGCSVDVTGDELELTVPTDGKAKAFCLFRVVFRQKA